MKNVIGTILVILAFFVSAVITMTVIQYSITFGLILAGVIIIGSILLYRGNAKRSKIEERK